MNWVIKGWVLVLLLLGKHCQCLQQPPDQQCPAEVKQLLCCRRGEILLSLHVINVIDVNDREGAGDCSGRDK